jgi:hypothetical protein
MRETINGIFHVTRAACPLAPIVRHYTAEPYWNERCAPNLV